MGRLELSKNTRVFTYKVAHDGGSAPNPYHGICTLAICKPAIRNSAKVGDIVIGIETGHSKRIVYCMQVTDVMSWSEYIKLCNGASEFSDKPEYASIHKKIPKDIRDQGDCIWKKTNSTHEPLDSHSRHDEGDYERDVGYNKRVLLSTKFWYFGKGQKFGKGFDLTLPAYMPMVNRGHVSNKNFDHREKFIEDFNALLLANEIHHYGTHGEPALPPDSDPTKCSRCRAEEKETDSLGEDDSVYSN